jgi:hypothetical protein
MGVQVDPIGLLAWLVLGALAGMAGALLGACALLLAGAPAAVGLVVAAGTAVLGAALLVLLRRALVRGRRSRPTAH